MFDIFRRHAIKPEARVDISKHIDDARNYLSNQLTIGHINSPRVPIDPDVQFSVREPERKESIRNQNIEYTQAIEYLHTTRSCKSFGDMVLDEIRSQQISAKEFYSRAGLDRKLYSALKRGSKSYQPSRNTAIRCCFALRLPIERTELFLKAAGYALSYAKKQDLIIRYCIERQIWSIFDVDDLLDALGENILFK
ncbi:MAG: hypothetical protein IJC56_05425 [Clostridia bacterium]|nr:hypothetical protein [Clostridia bacterium]